MNTTCPSAFKKIRNGGFTLIELCIVIATIAILAALLLPALAASHPDTQAYQCMENHRQLILGWQMYAEDNNDLLPPNDYPYTTAYATLPASETNSVKNWVVGTMANGFDVALPNELIYPTTLLSTYITNVAGYHCPADNYIDTFAGHKVHPRSYSMNSAVGTLWYDSSTYHGGNGALPIGSAVQGGWLPGAVYNPSQTTWFTYGKMSSFSRPGPANTWVIMDENPITINDGSIAVSAEAAAGMTYLIDWPAGNHNCAAGISFADGHVIIHKWLDPRTFSPPIALHGQQGGTGLQNPDNQDMFYLAPITSALR
jgi:prepilin-type N-terminal cleavage/methylation domain-containing protein